MPWEEGLRKTKLLIYFIESHLLYIRNTVKQNLQQSVLARGVLNILGEGMKKYYLGYGKCVKWQSISIIGGTILWKHQRGDGRRQDGFPSRILLSRVSGISLRPSMHSEQDGGCR